MPNRQRSDGRSRTLRTPLELRKGRSVGGVFCALCVNRVVDLVKSRNAAVGEQRAGPWARLASTASPMPPRSSAAGQPLVSPCKQAPLCLSFRGACTGGLGRGRRGGARRRSHWPQSFATRGCRRRARSDSEIKFQVGQLREISFSRPESFRLPPLQ